MAINPLQPPVNSRVIATVRPTYSRLTYGLPGGLNLTWVESGTTGKLPGLYFGVVTDPEGTVAYQFVGGYGISTDSSDRLVIGDGTRIVKINGGEECVVTLVDPAADVTVGDGDATIVYTGALTAATTYTVTLPAPATKQKGRIIIVKDGTGTASATEIIRTVVAGGSTIEGSANVDITAAWGLRSFLCTGTAWIRLGST